MTPETDMKERIFKAAFELFSIKGYDKVSLNEVVQKAGVSKGGLFHHFDSKYTLARDTLIWWARTHMEPGFMEEISETMTPQDILIHFIDFMLGIMEGEGGFTRFFWSVFDEAMRREDDHTIWIDFLEQYSIMISRIYGQMGVKDPEMKALIFLSNMDGMALYYEMLRKTGKDLDLKALREEFIRTYVTFEEGAAK
ncbi:MAG: TetR/AcrR family transcriptional regulator [Thermoplasmatota archaeon]